MPQKCCVSGCRANYQSAPSYTSVFGFPKNETLKQKWIRCINRENFIPSSRAVVCIQHFLEQFIVRNDQATRDDGSILVVPRDKLKLTSDAYPTIFPNQPPNVSKKITRKRKSAEKRSQELSTQHENSQSKYENDFIHSFEEFSNGCKERTNDWISITKESFILFFQLDASVCPKIIVSFKVFKNLSMEFWHEDILIDWKNYEWCLGKENKCDRWCKFDCLVSHLQSNILTRNIPSKIKPTNISKLLNECCNDLIENVDDTGNDEIVLKVKFIAKQASLLFSKQPSNE